MTNHKEAMTTAETSALAAASMHRATPIMRRLVCQFIADQGAKGATDIEIAEALDMNPSTARPRRGEVWAHGLITDSMGERRPTPSGRAATVWHVSEAGIKALGMPADSWSVKP